MTERVYPDGIDCIWLATDRNGHLAAFVTGGAGPIPVWVLASEAAPVEELEEIVCGLPRSTTARLLVPMQQPNSFVDLAERGLFVYDWRDVHRIAQTSTHLYEPVAVPISPVQVDALPEPIAALATRVRLGAVVFSDGTGLDIRAHVACREGPLLT